ncbi:MAG TPA: GNAT family N-acetyltransferase [Candidatus Enterenecus merdae]|nr:GNAT family N-acetyltransferase [Candidatus Enterenecus merdae]
MGHGAWVETDRLLLRPLAQADAPAVFAWAGDPEVNRYMAYPLHTSVEQTKAWLRTLERSRARDGYDFGFVRKEDGLLIGSGGVYRHKGKPWQRSWWTLGYNLRRDCWGQGYAAEAARAMVDFAHGKRRARVFLAEHAMDNPASGRVMEKCGMVRVGTGTYAKLDGSQRFATWRYRLEF